VRNQVRERILRGGRVKLVSREGGEGSL